MYQDLMQELRIHSPKFTDHNARKSNTHSKEEICIIPYMEKMEPAPPMLTARKASTKILLLKTERHLFFP